MCSSRKARLEFDDNQWNRVCDLCYNKLERKIESGKSSDVLSKTGGGRRKGVLNVSCMTIIRKTSFPPFLDFSIGYSLCKYSGTLN